MEEEWIPTFIPGDAIVYVVTVVHPVSVDILSATFRNNAAEVAETVPEAMRELALRLESRAAEAAELRTRLELTEKTQSTLEQERNQLLERVEKLETELEAERSKGFWQRLFGA